MWAVIVFILFTTIVSLLLDAATKRENYAEERCRYNHWS